ELALCGWETLRRKCGPGTFWIARWPAASVPPTGTKSGPWPSACSFTLAPASRGRSRGHVVPAAAPSHTVSCTLAPAGYVSTTGGVAEAPGNTVTGALAIGLQPFWNSIAVTV